ncbi:MAG: MBL fold metallo-hydrolase [Halieaceae bacterium]|jgi:glyoxylase-like metal-dependent hydrolase (beta-lactamase superfamily II)|nr:MBL fold metallo-hydrolase [Halieaceae bacterium]
MIEEIASDLYRIVVPLPENPLKEINSYILKSADRSLVIDSGLNKPLCEEVLTTGLNKLGVDLNKTDFVATHLHADHMGLFASLMTETSKAYMGALDTAPFRSKQDIWSKNGLMGSYGSRCGFPADELADSVKNHPGFKYAPARPVDYIDLHDGDVLDCGDYALRVIHTPGHTAGHICLYAERQKILISGDHVLGDITPNIASWSENDTPLNNYLDSLSKVAKLDVALCLPGHRSTIHNFHDRVNELKNHHMERANEILDILSDRKLNAYDIAGNMTWSIRANSWEEFPLMQRWFATGEAIAHIHYVEDKGLVTREETDDMVYYTATGGRL